MIELAQSRHEGKGGEVVHMPFGVTCDCGHCMKKAEADRSRLMGFAVKVGCGKDRESLSNVEVATTAKQSGREAIKRKGEENRRRRSIDFDQMEFVEDDEVEEEKQVRLQLVREAEAHVGIHAKL